MKYFSMFSGIGGFELGIGPGAECVGYSEIDKYAIKVYERHFRHENYGDATTIDTGRLPDFDLLVGGFPCQAFSVAGRRRGFDEARGTLFFEIARILQDKKPRHLVLENVKGLLSHDGGRTFQTIIRVLTDLGYLVEWQLLNSKDWGVPQNRERIYIVGHLGGGCGPQVFPIAPDGAKGPGQSEGQISGTIDAGYAKNHRHSGATYIVPTIRASDHKRDDNQTVVADAGRVRRLTNRECERLQGFPDDWTLEGVEPQTLSDGTLAGRRVLISDTQRYKMAGNAVTVNVVAAVIKELCL